MKHSASCSTEVFRSARGSGPLLAVVFTSKNRLLLSWCRPSQPRARAVFDGSSMQCLTPFRVLLFPFHPVPLHSHRPVFVFPYALLSRPCFTIQSSAAHLLFVSAFTQASFWQLKFFRRGTEGICKGPAMFATSSTTYAKCCSRAAKRSPSVQFAL